MTMTRFEPFTASFASRFFATLSMFLTNALDAHLRRRALKDDRAAFMHMATLDDGILHDIGVTGEDIAWGASLPLEVNAALAVRERAQSRRNAAASPARAPGPASRSGMSREHALDHMPPVVAARWFRFGSGARID